MVRFQQHTIVMSDKHGILAESLLRSTAIVRKRPGLLPFGVLLAIAPVIRIFYILTVLQYVFFVIGKTPSYLGAISYSIDFAHIIAHTLIITLFFVLPFVAFAVIALRVNSMEQKRGVGKKILALILKSTRFIPRLFGLSLAVIFLCAVSLVLVLTPTLFLVSHLTAPWVALFLFLAASALIPIVATLSFTYRYSKYYAILSPISVFESARNGYRLFSKNIRLTLTTWLSLLLINIVGLAISTLVALPLFFLSAFFTAMLGNENLGITFATAVFIAIILLAKSVLTTYNHTVWIVVFRSIAGPKDQVNELASGVNRYEASPLPRFLGADPAMQQPGLNRYSRP